MAQDLLADVQRELMARKGEWRQIAAAVPGVSYSFIAQLGRGKYKSEPSYKRLVLLRDYFAEKQQAAA